MLATQTLWLINWLRKNAWILPFTTSRLCTSKPIWPPWARLPGQILHWTYTKNLLVVYLKFKFNWYPLFLFAKSGKLSHEGLFLLLISVLPNQYYLKCTASGWRMSRVMGEEPRTRAMPSHLWWTLPYCRDLEPRGRLGSLKVYFSASFSVGTHLHPRAYVNYLTPW